MGEVKLTSKPVTFLLCLPFHSISFCQTFVLKGTRTVEKKLNGKVFEFDNSCFLFIRSEGYHPRPVNTFPNAVIAPKQWVV